MHKPKEPSLWFRQIEEKAYADAYKDAGKPVTKVGINFNVENEANFTEWVIR